MSKFKKLKQNNITFDEHLLMENKFGWKREEVRLKVTREPIMTGGSKKIGAIDSKLRKLLQKAYNFTKIKRPQDFNGEKLSVKKISLGDKGFLEITTRRTDYFTLWGIPGALPILMNKTNKEFISSKETDLPCGLYTANMVLTSDCKVIMSVISGSAGFGAGRLSFGFEEQMEVGDSSPFETVIRGFKEELGVKSSEKDIRILGFGKSLDIAYVAIYCVVHTPLTSKEIIDKKESAIDKNESTYTVVVPLKEVDSLCEKTVTFKKLGKYLSGYKVDEKQSFRHHRANLIRWDLTRKYLRIIKA